MDQRTFNEKYGYISHIHEIIEQAHNIELIKSYIAYVTPGLEFDEEHPGENYGAIRDELGKKIEDLVGDYE